MPRVHKVAALLKRWLLGTLQGGIQHQHLDYYLDEYTFRFNRRRSQARGLLFHRLAQPRHYVRPSAATWMMGIPIWFYWSLISRSLCQVSNPLRKSLSGLFSAIESSGCACPPLPELLAGTG